MARSLMMVFAGSNHEIDVWVLDSSLRSITTYPHPQTCTLTPLRAFHNVGMVVYNGLAASLLLQKNDKCPHHVVRDEEAVESMESMCAAFLQKHTTQTITRPPTGDEEWMSWCNWESDLVER